MRQGVCTLTTIVTDGITMAADMQATDGKVPFRYEGKMRKIQGHLVGAAGDVDNIPFFFQWYEECLENLAPTTPRMSKQFEAICVRPDGKIAIYGPRLTAIPVEAPFYAIGSGSYVALGAMEVGASPEEAVKAAIKHDIYTGIGVMTIERDKPKPRRAVPKGNGVRRKVGVGKR